MLWVDGIGNEYKLNVIYCLHALLVYVSTTYIYWFMTNMERKCQIESLCLSRFLLPYFDTSIDWL